MGSWKNFHAEIILSGGWINNSGINSGISSGSGPSSNSNLVEKIRVAVVLRAFISL